MSDHRRRARRLLLLLLAASLLCATAHARQGDAAGARETRAFHLTVTDAKGNLIGGVKREDLTAFDGGRRREIVSFGAGDVPASVMFLVDASSSSFGMMKDVPRHLMLRESLAAFLGLGNPSSEYFVTAFNQSPQILLDGSKNPYDVLIACDRLNSVGLRGYTALYDALYLSLNKLASRPTAKHVIILFSDGMDTVSKYKYSEVAQALKESDAIVYSVFISDPRFDSTLSYTAQTIMGELAETSGGALFFPQKGAEMKAVLTKIAEELRGQYEVTVAAEPNAKGDGWHDVRFKLGELRDAKGKTIKAAVRTRRGFYEAGTPRRK